MFSVAHNCHEQRATVEIISRTESLTPCSFMNPIQDGGRGSKKAHPPYQFLPCNLYNPKLLNLNQKNLPKKSVFLVKSF